MKTTMMMGMVVAGLCLFPRVAPAADVYVEVVCTLNQTDDEALDCVLDHPEVELGTGSVWGIEVEEEDTVYLYVTDFVVGGYTWLVGGATLDGTMWDSWTKTSSTATSDAVPHEQMVAFDISAATTGVPVRRGGGYVYVSDAGAR